MDSRDLPEDLQWVSMNSINYDKLIFGVGKSGIDFGKHISRKI